MQKSTNIDDIGKTMDEINEQTETLKTIQDSLKNFVIDGYDEVPILSLLLYFNLYYDSTSWYSMYPSLSRSWIRCELMFLNFFGAFW